MSLTVKVKFENVPNPATYNIPWTRDLNIKSVMEQCYDTYTVPHAQHPFTFWIQYYGTYNGTQIGYVAIEINGKRKAGNYIWFIYVNGTKINNSLDHNILNPKDVIEFKYETYSSANEEKDSIYTAIMQADKTLTI